MKNKLLALTCFLLLPLANPATGQGILYPRIDSRAPIFHVKSVKVTSDIRDSVAETTVEQVFENRSPIEQEGTYLFPLPVGATVTSFSLRAGDQVMEGKLLSRDEARGIYESIVRSRKDPALLEYMGQGLFRASVFPIPAHGSRTLTLKYAEIVKPEGSLRRFVYPLSTSRFSVGAPNQISIMVKVRTRTPLRTVHSLSHNISIRRVDDFTATASYEATNELPDRDFSVYYGGSGDEVGLSMLISPSGGDQGHFMLIASPKWAAPKDRALPKQVVFVLDRTGSMQPNGKMEQAKNALLFCLRNLNPEDRFDVITFNEAPDLLFDRLQTASPANVEKALSFVRNVDASGGTNIQEALSASLRLLRGADTSRKMIVFMTDGLPTVGETNIEKILAHVQNQNGAESIPNEENNLRSGRPAAKIGAHIFAFGVGYDVNVPFLDKLAEQNHGDADYVRPQENIEGIVSAFYSKVASPALTDLTLSFDGVETFDVYPKVLPDLFHGGQIVVTGRYRGSPTGRVSLTGKAGTRLVTVRLDQAFGGGAAHSGLVSRVWAMRKIGYLLDQIRLHSSQEVIDEIVRLSKEYGIITPYTSFLADDRPLPATRPLGSGADGRHDILYLYSESADREALGRSKDALNELSRRSRGESGNLETQRSLNAKQYQGGGQAPAGGQGGFGGGGFGGGGRAAGPGSGLLGIEKRNQLGDKFGDASVLAAKAAAGGKPAYQGVWETASVQNVAGRTFFRKGNVWFDNNYKSERKVIKVEALSDAHFQLLKARPELSGYAGVGEEVVIDLGKIAVQVGKDGKKSLTASELKEITGR